jgi:hypothetical protein
MALPLQASVVILGCLFGLRCGDCERWRWNRRRSVRDNVRFNDVITARLFIGSAETETTPDTDSSHRSDSARHQPSTPQRQPQTPTLHTVVTASNTDVLVPT